MSPEFRIVFGIATGVFWGLAFGIIPAVLARRWARQRDGVIAFWICFAGGALFGAYAALPLAVVESVWIWRRRSRSVAPGSGKAQELFR